MSEWRLIDQHTPPGEYILFFPAGDGRNALPKMLRIDRYPVSYPRQPSHWMPKPEDPK